MMRYHTKLAGLFVTLLRLCGVLRGHHRPPLARQVAVVRAVDGLLAASSMSQF